MRKLHPTWNHQHQKKVVDRCGFKTFRKEYQIDYLDPLQKIGCLDAPNALPSGSTKRYLNIDTIRETIEAWPHTGRFHREGAK